MEELIAHYAKLPQRQRLGGFTLALGGLLVAYWTMFYSSQASALSQLESQEAKLTTELAEQRLYRENLAKYESRLTDLQRALDASKAQLPDDPDVPQLLAQLGNKARQAGLAIDRFEPKGDAPKDFYGEIIFDVKTRGSYHEIGVFVDSLSRLDRILNITSISMTQPKALNQKVVLESSFTLKAYRFLEESAPQPATKGKGKK